MLEMGLLKKSVVNLCCLGEMRFIHSTMYYFKAGNVTAQVE